MLNNIVGYWAYIQRTYIGGKGGAYIWVIIAVIFRESEVYSIQLKNACIFLS
jgi:hypothetical protein